jgi:site-specific DNA recombinase
MSPSHVAKSGRRWRYYVSQAILQGRKHEAGSVARVSAMEVEGHVAEAVRAAFPCGRQRRCVSLTDQRTISHAPSDRAAMRRGDNVTNLRAAIERVVISRTTIEIELAEEIVGDDQNRILIIPWTPPSPYRRREIIQGEGEPLSATRPMKTKARAILIDALRDAHRWLDELTTNSNQSVELLAAREGKTERSIRMTLSLAFLAPALA